MFRTLAFLFLFFVGLILFTIFTQDEHSEEVKGKKEEKNLILGYCQTFERYALDLAQKNNLDVVKFGSSFEVMSKLKSQEIDYGVIGRRAYKVELSNDTLEIPLEEYGWTLVSSKKMFLQYPELENLEIHTYLDKEEVHNFFSFEANIVFHENLESALKEDLILIHWEDFRDDFELVVPLEGNAKVEKFRNPMLYMAEKTQPLEI